MATEQDINRIFEEMVSVLLTIVNSKLNDQKWKLAVLDVRATVAGSSWIKNSGLRCLMEKSFETQGPPQM